MNKIRNQILGRSKITFRQEIKFCIEGSSDELGVTSMYLQEMQRSVALEEPLGADDVVVGGRVPRREGGASGFQRQV